MNRLRYLREEKKLSLQDLKEQLFQKENIDIGRASLNNYERGIQNPKKETWDKLAHFFEVDTAYLMGLSDFKNPKQATPNNIKEYRTSRQMTLQELSELTSISEKMLDDFENGKKPILHSSTWLSIAEALRIPVSFLTDREKERLKIENINKTKQINNLERKNKIVKNIINLDSRYFSEFSDLYSSITSLLKLELSEEDSDFDFLKSILDDSLEYVILFAKQKKFIEEALNLNIEERNELEKQLNDKKHEISDRLSTKINY